MIEDRRQQRIMRQRKKILRNKILMVSAGALLLIITALLIIAPWNQGSVQTNGDSASKTSGLPEVTTQLSPTPPELSSTLQLSPSATETPATSTPSATSKQSSSPSLKPSSTPSAKPLANVVIGLDPGHQAKADSGLEPVAPGSSTMKKKVSSGTQGKWSRVPEHEVNLAVALLLKDLLKDAGAKVVMTREKADVDISNVERAKIFNNAKVDLGLRLHCNGSVDEKVNGAFMLVPSSNPFKDDCVNAAKKVLAAYGKATGISVTKGITYRSDQSGFNWCTRPIINIEMGHMTNKEEDAKLANAAFQKKMAQGLYNGILEYFASK